MVQCDALEQGPKRVPRTPRMWLDGSVVHRSIFVMVFVVLPALVGSAHAQAHGTAETPTQELSLAEQLQQLQADSHAKRAAPELLKQASLAIERARTRRDGAGGSAPDVAGAERAAQIAEAAMILARVKARQHRTRELLRIVRERRSRFQKRLAKAKQLLRDGNRAQPSKEFVSGEK